MSEVGRPRPEQYQPQVGRWSHAWRLGLALAISLVTLVADAGRFDSAPTTLALVEVVAGLAAFALVTQRRRRPVTIAVVTVALSTVAAMAAGPAILATVSLATRRRWSHMLGVGVLSVVCSFGFGLLYPRTQPEVWWVNLTSAVTVTSAVLAWGMYVGSRRELLWTLRSRAERAEAERDLRAQQARLEERSRIAREMHDVLAHRISQISMHAGALGYRDDLDVAELRAGVGVIRETSHRALADLRGVLGVLRGTVESDTAGDQGTTASGPTHQPQPTYDDLADLVEQARRAGTPIVHTDSVDGPAVPEDSGRTLYRIVQEGLTNAGKHAPGAEVRLEVAGSPPEGLRVTVRNRLGFGLTPVPGSGLGLIGLAERAALRGGTLEHGLEGEDFVLRGWIPWSA